MSLDATTNEPRLPEASDAARPLKAAKANDKSGPRAMSRVLEIFATLAKVRIGMTLTELSQALGVAKSTLTDSLRALAADGYLICQDNIYRLGPRTNRLASAIVAAWSSADTVRYSVRELAAATKESVGYAIADWEVGHVIYVDAVTSTQPVHYAMRPGVRAPLYASAAGRIVLAFTEEARRKAYLEHAHMRPLTRATRTSVEELEAHLGDVRRLGYCASFGEMLPDTAAIAVPVFDGDELAGALMVATPIERMRANFSTLLSTVVKAGRRASGVGEGEIVDLG